MKEFLKKNFVLVLAFVLPVLFIIVVVLGTYLPSRFLKTGYDFIYATCTHETNYYYCDNYLQSHYSVVGGRLMVTTNPYQDSDNDGILDVNENYSVRIFYHDTKHNESREITYVEAQQLSLSGLLTSPDGVTVSSGYNRGTDFFIFFGSGSSYEYYLMKGSGRSKLNLVNEGRWSYYPNNFEFIGWVLPGRN